jgi:superfamily II DNA/RNA helicase
MTATPDRADRRDIRELFGEESYLLDGETALKRGLFPHVDYHLASATLDDKLKEKIEKEKSRAKLNHDPDEITNEVLVREQEQEFVKKILEHSCKHGLIFCRNIAHANLIAELMPSCKAFHSGSTDGTKSKARVRQRNEKTLEEFKSGKLRYIAAVDALNEGVDVPEVDLVVLLRAHGFKNAWIQQIGRGLRLALKGKGKKKLTVLDFAHNRRKLDSLFQTFGAALAGSLQKIKHKKTLVIKFEGITYTFERETLDLLEFYSSLKKNFYETWQEASRAVIDFGFEYPEEYRSGYHKDPRLPSTPNKVYTDFPGWTIFLGREKKNHYETWQKASKASIELKIKSQQEYINRRGEDPRLPSVDVLYKMPGFPGFEVFLGREKYTNWRDASRASIKLAIEDSKDYIARRGEDPKLPSIVSLYNMPGFPGIAIFLGKKKRPRKKKSS